ncbi:hypothetical protein D3C73_868500 [compost metagenome]
MVTILQNVAKWDQFMVHFGTNTTCTNIGVDLKGKVQCCGIVRQLNQCTFWREDKNLIGEKIHLKIIHKIHGILIRAAQYIAYLFDPLIQA